MADAAARREARRRRILENSEYRLQRIAGHVDSDTNNDGHQQQNIAKHDIKSTISNLNINGILPSETLVNSQWDDPLEIDNQILEENLQSTLLRNRNFAHDNIRNENGVSQVQNTPTSDFTSAQSVDEFRQNFNRKTVKDTQDVKSTEKSTSIILYVLASRLAYVILAAIVNLMLILKLEDAFGTSIIVPFLLMLTSRLWINGKLAETQTNSSMLVAALILCNLRPDFINKLRITMNFIFRIIKDLSIYVFSFVMIYYTISRYWIDVDALLPNKVEIIVDRHAT